MSSSHRVDYHPRVPGSSAPATRGIFNAVVIRNATLCREHYRLTFRIRDFPDAAPGQFVQVLCRRDETGPSKATTSHEWAPGWQYSRSGRDFEEQVALLRRPFSIGGLRRQGDECELDIIGRTIGPGTRMLGAMRAGDSTEVLGPLGRPFEFVEPARISILVAGGVGLPPLLWLAEALQGRGLRRIAICGARSAELLPLNLTIAPRGDGGESACCEEFNRVDALTIVTSDDGSVGMRGTTADALTKLLARTDEAAERIVVYTCGPEAMMRSIATICAQQKIRCFAALERVMGCGMGTCQSCVVRVHDASEVGWHYELCCTHGPVFDATRVDWCAPH